MKRFTLQAQVITTQIETVSIVVDGSDYEDALENVNQDRIVSEDGIGDRETINRVVTVINVDTVESLED